MLSLLMLAAVTAATPSTFELPPPPRLHIAQPAEPAPTSSKSATTLSRGDVARLYQQQYLPQSTVAHGWTGNIGSCVAGSTSTAYRAAVIGRINVFRALAGLPPVAEGGTASRHAELQAAALIMAAQNDLHHFPPSSWACWTSAGYSGAGIANLALGVSGPAAIDLYIDDHGSFNAPVGHRRWLLFPPRTTMASGDIPAGSRSNALWVFGDLGARPSMPGGVAWPPRGFVPHQLLPAGSNRWSLSYPNADFTHAVVTMSRDGSAIAVTYDSRRDNGYGDNTLVWRPAIGTGGVVYGAGGVNRTYSVQVSGIAGSGVPSTISYTVTVIDGNEAPLPAPRFRNGFE